jgi:NAD(P)-dependent dehydrogenase (short-subunit alcohol dehydrogenase family)
LLYFQQVLKYGPAQAAMMFVPMTVRISAATLASGRWSRGSSPFLPATKGAIARLTKATATDLVADGIRCNCVCPGPTNTAQLSN